VVDPTDVATATEAIGSILRDASLRSRMGAAGRVAVESHYNWDRVAAETREFVRGCVAHFRG